jgi:hypothetical protein
MSAMNYRRASAHDASAIAEMHADSWRRNYRGAYLENLQVSHDLKRHGIGKRLVITAARSVVEMRPASGLYLWVLEQNTAAQAFYEAIDGARIERQVRGPFPGGGTAPGLRVQPMHHDGGHGPCNAPGSTVRPRASTLTFESPGKPRTVTWPVPDTKERGRARNNQ